MLILILQIIHLVTVKVMGLDKLMDTIEFVLKNKEKISRDLKAAKSLEKCFLIFQEINNIGGRDEHG